MKRIMTLWLVILTVFLSACRPEGIPSVSYVFKHKDTDALKLLQSYTRSEIEESWGPGTGQKVPDGDEMITVYAYSDEKAGVEIVYEGEKAVRIYDGYSISEPFWPLFESPWANMAFAFVILCSVFILIFWLVMILMKKMGWAGRNQ